MQRLWDPPTDGLLRHNILIFKNAEIKKVIISRVLPIPERELLHPVDQIYKKHL